MEKINKLKEKREVTAYNVVHNIKGVLYLGLALSPVIGICAGCATEAQKSETSIETVVESNRAAVIIEDGHATILDYTTREFGNSNRSIWIILTNGGKIGYVITEKSSLIFIEDNNAHELAIQYAQSIVGDNYTEYNTEIKERVRTQG